MQPLISRKAVDTFMQRPLDSFLWMKALKREDLMAELRQFPVRPMFKTRPWLHQLVSFYIGCCYPRFSFLLDPGLGKSWLSLAIFNQRLRERRAKRLLVFVPRNINHESWENAILDHTHFEPTCVNMKDSEAKFEALMKPRGEVSVVTYQGFALAMCTKARTSGGKSKMVPDPRKIKQLVQVYDAAALDEIHKVSKADTMWFDLLMKTTEHMGMVHGLTGTLFNRDVNAMWTPLRLVDAGETLGETPTLFQQGFFTSESNGFGNKLVFNRSMVGTLNKMIGHRSIRYADREVLDLPQLFIKPAVRFHMSDETREHYLRAVEGVINAGSIQGKKSAYITMRQATAGYLAWKDEHGPHRIDFKEQPKLDYMEALLDRMDGAKLVISHEYTETGLSITKRLTKLGIKHVWLHGGTKDSIATKVQFCSDPTTRVLVMNSDAGGTGTDGLQVVCSDLLFYETPTGPTPRFQVIKRLHRPGQKKRVRVTDMVMLRTCDMGIVQDVTDGKDFFERVMAGTASRGSFFG